MYVLQNLRKQKQKKCKLDKHFYIFNLYTKGFQCLPNKQVNKQTVRHKYRNYARLYHPDRNGGSKEKFAELQSNKSNGA